MASRASIPKTCSTISHFSARNSCLEDWELHSWTVKYQLAQATRWYWPSVCFCDSTAPSPSLLLSVSRRKGLLKSANSSTRGLKTGFLKHLKGTQHVFCEHYMLILLTGTCDRQIIMQWLCNANFSHTNFRFFFAGSYTFLGRHDGPNS